jgi:hypothetical protein
MPQARAALELATCKVQMEPAPQQFRLQSTRGLL